MKSPTLVHPTRRSTARDPRTVELDRVAGGAFAALSSDGTSWYTVRQVGAAWQCECKGYAALPRCYFCLSTEHVAGYVNHWDNGARIELCESCANPVGAVRIRERA